MKLSVKNCGQILYELTRGVKNRELNNVIRHFIFFLTRQRMLTKIDYIIKEFIDQARERRGVEKLEIESGWPMSKTQLNKISRHFGAAAEAEVIVNKAILGGVKIKRKNIIWDASLRTQLERLKTKLS